FTSFICFLLFYCFFFSSRRRHTRSKRDWSSDVCSSDLSICLLSAHLQNIILQKMLESSSLTNRPMPSCCMSLMTTSQNGEAKKKSSSFQEFSVCQKMIIS